MSGILNVMLADNAAVAAGTGWGTVSSMFALSTSSAPNDTATQSTAGTWATATSLTGHSSGAFYAEVVIVSTVDGNVQFGVVDSSQGAATMDGFFSNPADRIGLWSNGFIFSNGSDFSPGNATSSTSYSASNGDIFGICYNAGKLWITKNGTSIVGDPVAGTGNPMTVSGAHTVSAACAIKPASSDVIRIVTGASALSHLPSGYTAWG